MTKTDLVFPAFSSRFVDFAVQFCFHCKFSFNEERRSSQVWQWHDFLITTNHDSLLRIATNEISSFWIDHWSRQMAFFVQRQGKRPAFAFCWNIWNKKAFRYYIKQIVSMLPCIWFSNRSQKTSIYGKTIVTHSATPRVPLICSYHILMSCVIYYWTDTWQHGIY